MTHGIIFKFKYYILIILAGQLLATPNDLICEQDVSQYSSINQNTIIADNLFCKFNITNKQLKNIYYPVIINNNTKLILLKLQQQSSKLQLKNKKLGEIMVWVAKQLLNSKYKAHLLDNKQQTNEYLYISLSDTDCFLFIEEVLMISKLIKNNMLTMNNYIHSIRQIRYHNNEVSYCTRNHYLKDWAITNKYRGILTDVAIKLTHKTMPYKAHILSDNLKQQNNLSNKNLNCILQREKLINQQKIGFIPIKSLYKYLKYIHSGDIIGIIRTPGLADAVHHVGISYVNYNNQHRRQISMIHASSLAKKVIISHNLNLYLKQFPDTKGIILLRAK